MRNLKIQGPPEAKIITVTSPTTFVSEGVTITIPVGTVIEVDLHYKYPALDNNPTPNNKANLLSDQTQALVGLPPDSDTYTGTVDKAFAALARRIPSIYQQLMTGRIT